MLWCYIALNGFGLCLMLSCVLVWSILCCCGRLMIVVGFLLRVCVGCEFVQFIGFVLEGLGLV